MTTESIPSAGRLRVRPITPARAFFAALVLIILLTVGARLLPGPRTVDDAFITFRYSRNIVEGHGFVYNPGVRTLGTTTPLFTLLMAGAGWITGSDDYPWFALIANTAADALSAVLLALLVRRLGGGAVPGAIVGVLWAIAPTSVTFAIGGMETSVAILWMVAAASAYVAGRERWMALFAALGVLTRVDALLWVGLFFAHQLFVAWRAGRGRGWARLPWRSWAIFVATLAPWYLFSAAYFGGLLSRSLSAKRVVYIVDDFQALVRLLQQMATPFFEYETFGVPGIAVGIVLYPALAAVGTLYAVKRQPRALPFLLYPWLYVAIFSAMNPLIFRWYLAPLLPPYFVAIVMGVWALAGAVAEAVQHPRLGPVASATLGALFVALSLNAWVLHPDHGADRPAPEMAWHKIELNYRRMGEILHNEYGVDEATVVAAGDIGAVGYYSRAHIFDTVGLVTPEVSAYYPLDASLLAEGANYAVPPALIMDYEPDYVVLMESFVRNGLARDTSFKQRYAQARIFATDYYGTGMILYQRRDLISKPCCGP
ncbi:MAG: hypothetical protein OZ934_13425 [Anaerolineae bacterium]|nr:hypothetical protein [Anaerolineae bacterium]